MKAIVDKLLTNVSTAYIPEGYISEQFLPFIGVKQKTGLLGKYGQQHLILVNSVVGGRGKFRRVETIVRDSDAYSLKGHGLEGLVSEDDYDNVELPFDAEKDETIGLTSVLWLEKEKGLADVLTDTAIMTQNDTLVGADQYSDYVNSDPIGDFATARGTTEAGCGIPPNIVGMPWGVWNVLRFHPAMLDALGFKYATPGGLSLEQLAVAMGVEKVLISMAKYNSAKENQTAVLAPCWGKHIVFAVSPAQAAKYQVSLGYRLGQLGQQPRKVFKEPEFNPPGSTKILVKDVYQHFLSNVKAGYLIKNAIA